jgi:prevent-host-death family protein
MRLGLCEAKRHFARVIRAVRAGTDVTLTDRGQPLAVIEPIKRKRLRDAALRAMADDGLVTPAARRGPTPAPRWRPARVKGKPLATTIIEDREDLA